MRYAAAEKLEIIRLVEQSALPVRRTLDNSVIFEGSEPFELAIQGTPTTFAEGKDVVLSFPVSISDHQTVGLRIQLSIRQAEYLATQIQPVLLTARSRARKVRI